MSASIDRSNRLLSLRANPGFGDLIRLSQEIVDSATAILVDFGGWDAMQITVLKARAQAAKEHHGLLFGKITEAINDGIQDQATSDMPDKTPAEILEQGDYVRQEVLAHFSDLDQESRIPGSY